MTIRQLKRYIARWQKQGLTEDSLVLVYSDKQAHADSSVGIMFVEGSRPGSYGIMFAPGASRCACEHSDEIAHCDAPVTPRPSDA